MESGTGEAVPVDLNDLMQDDIGRTAFSMIMWVLFAGPMLLLLVLHFQSF